MKCRICSNYIDNKEYTVKEMLLGLRDEFKYFKCSKCGCLQINEIPANISTYYPQNYYSFSPIKNNLIKNYLKSHRNAYALTNKGFIGKICYKIFPGDNYKALSRLDLKKEARILDVGCGNGRLLNDLRYQNFTNLLGIDLYLEKDIHYDNGVSVLKRPINQIIDKGLFDLIIYNHVFEHIEDPFFELQAISKLLDANGILLLRIPIVSSYAWEHYGVNWVQIDAPRHFYLHSFKSIKLLLSQMGFELFDYVYDSTELQFYGSEKYLRNIPLKSGNSYWKNKLKSVLNTSETKHFRERAKNLNSEERGDQATFYIKKIS